MSAPTIILLASGLLQYMLLGVSQVSSATMLHSVEAFVLPAISCGKTKTTSIDARALRLGNNRQRFIAPSCREKPNADCGERNEEYEIEGKEPTCIDLGSNVSNTASALTTDGCKTGETIQIFVKRAATLILAASMAVTAPMPVMAEWEPAILTNPPTAHATLSLSSVFQVSPLILAAAAPYTGQLVDTSNAIVVRLDSGVTYNDLREGTGEGVATEGKRVNIQWVLKRSNGYSIDSSAQNDGVPFIFVVGGNSKQGKENRAIPGLDEGIRGMRVGGIRRIVIPPSLAYIEGLGEDSPGPVPPGFGPKQRIKRVMENRMDVPDESFLLDVKLTRAQ